MTTTDTGARPPRQRTPPAPRSPRTRPARHANGNVDQLAEMQRQIDELRAQQGAVRYVASEPDNVIGTSRVASDEELTDWQRRVRNKTEPTPVGLERREKPYNYPLRWYMKADGSVVQLQGDPQNLAYYTDRKKFHVLSDAEVREYLSVERPKIVKRQMEKASLINIIRRAVALDPALAAGLDPSWELDLDKMTIDELQAQLEEIAHTPTSTGQKRRLMRRLPRLEDADAKAAEAEAERLLKGVETKPTRSVLEQIDAKVAEGMRSGGTREIEVTPRNVNSFA